MLFKNREKKRYLKKLILETKELIWNLELRVDTAQEGREMYRRDFDKLGEMIKAYEEAVEKLMDDLGIKVDLMEELEALRMFYKPEELTGLNEEARNKAINESAEETRRMRKDWLAGKMDWKKLDKKEAIKRINRIIEIIDFKKGLETDAVQTKEKMMGKWIEKEGARFGGIDQEIDVLAKKMAGGWEFVRMIEDKLKKL